MVELKDINIFFNEIEIVHLNMNPCSECQWNIWKCLVMLMGYRNNEFQHEMGLI